MWLVWWKKGKKKSYLYSSEVMLGQEICSRLSNMDSSTASSHMCSHVCVYCVYIDVTWFVPASNCTVPRQALQLITCKNVLPELMLLKSIKCWVFFFSFGQFLAGATAGTTEPSGREAWEGPEEEGPRPTFHRWQHGEPITSLGVKAVPVIILHSRF